MAFEAVNDERAPDGNPLVVHLHRCLRQRAQLFAQTDAVRLHDAGLDGSDGPAPLARCTVDGYAGYAVLNTYDRAAYDARFPIARALLALGARGVWLKVRERADLRRLRRDEITPTEALVGQGVPSELVVSERGMRFEVRLDDGLSTGLFIDQRDNRRRVRDDCAGKCVLNLFAYTCSFSVAAGVGGAEKVISVDVSSSALERGDRNLRLNALAPEQHRLLRDDCRKWLARALRRDERFDWVVLDPPVFGTVKGQPFVVSRDYASLVRSCLELLAGGGKLLAVLNHQKTSDEDFVRLLTEAAFAARREIALLDRPPAPSDCAAEGAMATKSAILTLA